MDKSKKVSVGRRGFLKGAAAGATALVAKPQDAKAQQSDPRRAAAPSPSAREVAAGTTEPVKVDVQTTERPGSDFMVDVLKTLGFEYVVSNPGSSFCALHESVIKHGGNQSPEFIAAGLRARNRRIAARLHGDLQRLLRPRAGVHGARQHDGCHQATILRGLGAQRPRCRRHGSRIYQVG